MDESNQKRFDRLKNKGQNAKNNNLQATAFGKVINFSDSNKLTQDSIWTNYLWRSIERNNQHLWLY